MSYRKLVCLSAVAATLLVSSPSFASVVLRQYRVCSTSVINGPDGAKHGLWTNGDPKTGPGSNYFDIDALFTEYLDGTATLVGSATNPDSLVAKIDLAFGGYTTDPGTATLKNGGGGNPDDWWFYETISGTIMIGADTYNINDMVTGYLFQVGVGANDKDGALGASAWVMPDRFAGMSEREKHWDLNLTLKPVPEPATIAVWSILGAFGGLGMLWSKRRKRK